MNSEIKTLEIPHLGGSTVGYKFGRPYDPALPTLVLTNSWSTSAQLYRPQFSDERLNKVVNVLAIEPYGHGRTRASYQDFTYWDSAIAILQVLDELKINHAFAQGTSQGGWVVVRAALLAPDRIKGIVPVGTSMDYESQESMDLGCWNGVEFCSPAIDALAVPVDDDWEMPEEMIYATLTEGFGDTVTEENRAFWLREHQENYRGDAGRQRLRTIAINLRDRDGLHGRLDQVRCPVLWMQGTADRVYSVANAQREIKLFKNASHAELKIVTDGQHFLSASDSEEVNEEIICFIERWS